MAAAAAATTAATQSLASLDSLHSEILAEEDATWRALCHAGSELLPFLSADCIMLLPLGMRLTNESEPSIEEVMNSPAFVPWETYKMSDVHVTPLGEDAAVISYKADAKRPELDKDHGEADLQALISSTWRMGKGGKWLMCLHQQTPFLTPTLP